MSDCIAVPVLQACATVPCWWQKEGQRCFEVSPETWTLTQKWSRYPTMFWTWWNKHKLLYESSAWTNLKLTSCMSHGLTSCGQRKI